jgi:hypothetical protein
MNPAIIISWNAQVKTENGRIVEYDKRQIPAERPVKTEGGRIVPYDKRQIPAERPVSLLWASPFPHSYT